MAGVQADGNLAEGTKAKVMTEVKKNFRPEFLEGNSQVEKRAATLLDLLRGRKEYSIAVVAHKGYLRELYKGTLARLKVGRCSGAPVCTARSPRRLTTTWARTR